MSELLSDNEVVNRVFEHINYKTTDLGDGMWREPVRNYTCPNRFNAEIELMWQLPIEFGHSGYRQTSVYKSEEASFYVKK